MIARKKNLTLFIPIIFIFCSATAFGQNNKSSVEIGTEKLFGKKKNVKVVHLVDPNNHFVGTWILKKEVRAMIGPNKGKIIPTDYERLEVRHIEGNKYTIKSYSEINGETINYGTIPAEYSFSNNIFQKTSGMVNKVVFKNNALIYGGEAYTK